MYKKEARDHFDELLSKIQHDVVHAIYHMVPIATGDQLPKPRSSDINVTAGRGAPARVKTSREARRQQSVMADVVGDHGREPVVAGKAKVGRNEPCPCGAGKKYKKCHGA